MELVNKSDYTYCNISPAPSATICSPSRFLRRRRQLGRGRPVDQKVWSSREREEGREGDAQLIRNSGGALVNLNKEPLDL